MGFICLLLMELSEQAIKAYSQLTLADCARIDCALVIRTVNFLHNAALHTPGGVPEEFDAIHAAYQAVPKHEKDAAFKQGKEEGALRQAQRDAAAKKKVELPVRHIGSKPVAPSLTTKSAEKLQYAFVMERIGAGRQHFSAEDAEIYVRREWTKSGNLLMNPEDLEIGSSNTPRWKQAAASARQSLKNDGFILWSALAQRWIIPLTQQDLQKKAKKRVENTQAQVIEIRRTGT